MAAAKSGELRLSQKIGLHEALSATIPGLAKSGSQEVRLRWFALIGLAKPKLAKGLMQKLADALGNSPNDQHLHVLKADASHFSRCSIVARKQR